MVCINQYFGIGDVIFCQTLIDKLYLSKGEKVLWPVKPEFVESLNRAYPKIHFINWELINLDYRRETEYELQDMKIIPLRFNDIPVATNMGRKYSSRGYDYNVWKEKAKYRRFPLKEKELFKLLNPSNEPYNLIGQTFQSDNKGQIPIAVDNGLKNIYMDIKEGYSLFDWSLLIENASNIRSVSTATFYLFELLNLKASEIHLYPRIPIESDFRNIEYLMTKNYILH